MAKAKPAPVAEEQAGDEIQIGSIVEFLGYDDSVPEDERVLEQGEQYEVVGLPEVVDGEETGYILKLDNPDFNKKKKAHPETNPEFLEAEVFAEEVALVEDEEEEQEEEQEEEAAPATKGKAKAKAEEAPAKGKAKAKAEEAPAKGKGKAKAEEAPAKGKGKAATKPEPKADPAGEDELPDLENEDESVLAIVAEAGDNLIGAAQELESEVAANEYRLGGVLFHIKKDGDWKELDAKYQEKGGFQAFLQDYFNVDYRKAQYLIEIYVNFTQAGIADAAEVVARLGWTKAQKIAKPLLLEDMDVDALIEAADNNTVVDLTQVLKEDFHVGGTGGDKGEKKTRITLKFRYTEEQGKVVEDILDAAGEQFGTSGEEALFQILSEWAVTNNVDTAAEQEEEEEQEEEVQPKGKAKASAKPAAKPTAKASAKPAAKPAAKPTAKAAAAAPAKRATAKASAK